MAKQMSFTSPEGFTSSESYWVPAVFGRYKLERKFMLEFWGFKDKDARMGALQPMYKQTFEVHDPEYGQYFDEVNVGEDISFTKQAYIFASEFKIGIPPGEGEEDTRKSFFDSATDV